MVPEQSVEFSRRAFLSYDANGLAHRSRLERVILVVPGYDRTSLRDIPQ
jgi:hypothetical protein